MKRVVFLLLFMVGCTKTVYDEYPPANIPLAARQENWIGSNRQGSCVWATAVNLLQWQGNDRAAARIRMYGDGANLERLTTAFDQEGIRYATTETADVSFLERACETRRGAGVCVTDHRVLHCVALVGLTENYAIILDNNEIEEFEWVPRPAFLKDWRASGGWAFVITGSPVPPIATKHR
jgi:hypothetical protein